MVLSWSSQNSVISNSTICWQEITIFRKAEKVRKSIQAQLQEKLPSFQPQTPTESKPGPEEGDTGEQWPLGNQPLLQLVYMCDSPHPVMHTHSPQPMGRQALWRFSLITPAGQWVYAGVWGTAYSGSDWSWMLVPAACYPTNSVALVTGGELAGWLELLAVCICTVYSLYNLSQVSTPDSCIIAMVHRLTQVCMIII